MSESILVGYDDSEGGQRAVDCAAEFARAKGVPLVVAHVIEWSPYTFHTVQELEERHKRREEELVRARAQLLKPVTDRLSSQGLSVESEIRHGHASETLVSIAQEKGATHIFIGRRGVSKVKSMLFGSVSGSLVQIAPVPVTVVP